jgi:organic radical activating enzyme
MIEDFVVDIKCPSTKVLVPHCTEWFKMRAKDQIKFVVANDEDLAFVDSILPAPISRPSILISPMIPVRQAFAPLVGPKELEWAVKVVEYCKLHNYRFSWQQHKLLWGDKRGV